jgi:hypothetical protein
MDYEPTDDAVTESLYASLIDPHVRDLAAEYIEIGLDELLASPIVDSIPIVSTIRNLAGGVGGYRDAWLTRKLTMLIYGFGDFGQEDLERWRKRILTDEDRRDTGERVLAVIDSVTAAYKAELIGRAFRVFLDGRTDRAGFLRLIEMIDRALSEDLRYLIDEWKSDDENATCERLISIGLMVSRRSALLDENSQPPEVSSEGVVLRVGREACGGVAGEPHRDEQVTHRRGEAGQAFVGDPERLVVPVQPTA